MRIIVEVAIGVLAGTVGTAGGITSLVSYPALLVLGLTPLQANIANIVALVACWPSSALASRPELKGRLPHIRVLAIVSVVGGATGSLLFVITPSGAFTKVVPFLLAGASVILLIQPRFQSHLKGRIKGSEQGVFGVGLVLITLYNGYFGAGAGVMLLTLDQVTSGEQLVSSNALKNMLIGAATVGGAATLILVDPVRWMTVVPLALGLFLGGLLGPHLTRRIPAALLRMDIALLGVGFALWLWIS